MKKWINEHKKQVIWGICIFIVLVVVAIIIFVFQNNPKGYPNNANWADKIFYFLDDWASASAPLFTVIGVIVALVLGVASLLQTQKIKEYEHKERFLFDLSEWATNVITVIQELDRVEFQTTLYYSQSYVRLQVLDAKRHVMMGFVKSDLFPYFTVKINDVFNEFDKYLKSENKQHHGEDCIKSILALLEAIGKYDSY